MADVISKRCYQEGCGKRLTFGVERSKASVYFRDHAWEGKVNGVNRRCAQEDCSKRPSFGVNGRKVPAYCKDHARASMMYITNECSS